MDVYQRLVVVLALLLIFAMGLFPPWRMASVSRRTDGMTAFEINAGYSFSGLHFARLAFSQGKKCIRHTRQQTTGFDTPFLTQLRSVSSSICLLGSVRIRGFRDSEFPWNGEAP